MIGVTHSPNPTGSVATPAPRRAHPDLSRSERAVSSGARRRTPNVARPATGTRWKRNGAVPQVDEPRRGVTPPLHPVRAAIHESGRTFTQQAELEYSSFVHSLLEPLIDPAAFE